MAFWGVEVKPGKPYTHTSDDSRGTLRITQATLGNGSGPKKSTVQCNVGSKKPVLLCSMLPDKIESCSLDLEFEEAEEVVFSVIGPRSVHLTGYFVSHRGVGAGDETDSYGEDIVDTGSDESDSYETDESYDDDFIDDGDVEMFGSSPSPKRNSGVVIEEIVDDEKPANASGKPSSPREKNQASGSVSEGQNLLTGPESEDEDGFPIRFQRKNNNKINNGDDVKVNDTNGKGVVVDNVDPNEFVENREKQPESRHEADNAKNSVNPKKKRKDKAWKGTTSEPSVDLSVDENGASVKENAECDNEGETLISMDHNNVVGDPEEPRPDSNGTSAANLCEKASKKNKKKKKRTKEDTSSDVNEIHAKASEDAGNNAERSNEGGSKKKRKKAKGSEDNKPNGSAEINTENIQPQQTRTFPNGFIVEELQMGKPDGKRASIGKKVSVHYIGKLKDGKIFDSNIGQRPFEFRLGVGQVIKGWDIGVDGMRVGDKRRLTIPPSLGYGDRRAGKIPPNSWLTFDVELVNVK